MRIHNLQHHRDDQWSDVRANAIDKQIGRVYLSGGLETPALYPYGMHPDLDPLWSTDRLAVEHVGADATRLKKISFIAKYPIVLNTLRVCWRNPKNKYNCGECEKCLRTMVALYAIDALKRCRTFPTTINKKTLSNVLLAPSWQRYYRQAIDAINPSRDTQGIIPAIRGCLIKNDRSPGLGFRLRKLRQSLGKWDTRHTGGNLTRLYCQIGLNEVIP